MSQRWKGRYADYIRGAFGLSLARAPLFAFVARLAHQKGIDLVIEAADHIVARGAQLVIVGRGEPEAERAVLALRERWPDAIGARVGFDPQEARALFAAADFLLMPSRFEPCGLSQMFAQRFGALPIAHRTGGLAETVDHGVTGLMFDAADAPSLRAAIDAAFDVYASPREFQAMRRLSQLGGALVNRVADVFLWGNYSELRTKKRSATCATRSSRTARSYFPTLPSHALARLS